MGLYRYLRRGYQELKNDFQKGEIDRLNEQIQVLQEKNHVQFAAIFTSLAHAEFDRATEQWHLFLHGRERIIELKTELAIQKARLNEAVFHRHSVLTIVYDEDYTVDLIEGVDFKYLDVVTFEEAEEIILSENPIHFKKPDTVPLKSQTRGNGTEEFLFDAQIDQAFRSWLKILSIGKRRSPNRNNQFHLLYKSISEATVHLRQTVLKNREQLTSAAGEHQIEVNPIFTDNLLNDYIDKIKNLIDATFHLYFSHTVKKNGSREFNVPPKIAFPAINRILQAVITMTNLLCTVDVGYRNLIIELLHQIPIPDDRTDAGDSVAGLDDFFEEEFHSFENNYLNSAGTA